MKSDSSVIERCLHPNKSSENEINFIRYALDCAAIVAVTDACGTITFANEKFCEISGYNIEELIGANHRILQSGFHDKSFFSAMYREIARGNVWRGEICNRSKNGSNYWVDTTIVPHLGPDGKVVSYTSIRFDITPRKKAEEALNLSLDKLEAAVNVDPLTGLANRRRFQIHLKDTLAKSRNQKSAVYLCLIDIDSFKEINDSFGHDYGDKVLRSIARRLESVLGDRVFVARLSGDEFALILTGFQQEEAVALFEELQARLRTPLKAGLVSRRFTASMGVAVWPKDAPSAGALFKLADIALYHAKRTGRDRWQQFRPDMKAEMDERATLLQEIEAGLEREELCFHYQPIVPAKGQHRVSLEALMRWRQPGQGLREPAAFLEGIRDPALRATLGLFMLDSVFADIAKMNRLGVFPARIALNLTNADFRSDEFADHFFSLLEEKDIAPSQFCMEVTEGMFLGRDQKRVETGLRRFHNAGVSVALDDFGTGYASLTHLRRLPIDRLKIDKSFVSNLVCSDEDQAIVRGVITIAHSLGKVVTAEGVETKEQAELLTAMGCDSLQGWLFGKASGVENLPDVISQRTHDTVHKIGKN